MAEDIWVKVGGVQHVIVEPRVKVAGTWRLVEDVYVKTAGAWRHSWPPPPPNSVPTAGTIVGQSGTIGTAFAFTIPPGTFTDADGDPLTLSASGLPPGVTFNPATGAFSGTPTTAGSYPVTVTANDGNGGIVTSTFTITIAAVPNSAPVVASPIPDQAGTTGTAFSYTFPVGTFTDANGDPLTYSASPLPAGITFNPATRTFSGTPTVAATTAVVVTANDGNGGTVTDTFNIVVAAAGYAIGVAITVGGFTSVWDASVWSSSLTNVVATYVADVFVVGKVSFQGPTFDGVNIIDVRAANFPGGVAPPLGSTWRLNGPVGFGPTWSITRLS